MKQSRLEKFYTVGLLVILAGIVIHAPLSVWLGTVFPSYELLIKSWKEIIMVLLMPLAGIIIARRKMWRQLWDDLLLQLIALYATVHLLFIIISPQQLAATAAGLIIDLRYLLFFTLIYIGVLLMPTMRRNVIITAVIGAFVVMCFALLQLFLPPDALSVIGYSKDTISPYLTVDKNPQYIRISSTLRGPNPLGAFADTVLALLASFVMLLRARLKNHYTAIGVGILTIGSLVALWLSYSRSAWIGAVVALAIAIMLTPRVFSRKTWAIATVSIAVVLAGVFTFRDTAFISNVVLHENPSGGSAVSSNDGHVDSLHYGLAQLIEEPFGKGVGSTGSASLLGDSPTIVENQYLFVAHEIGWVGMLLFIAISALVLLRLYRRRHDWLSLGVFASGVGLAIIGILQPVWADDTVAIVWWALAATALAGGKHGRKPTKQKAIRTT